MDDLWEDGVVNAPLNRRAWVFQERYLSPRVLHFGARQLFWECMEREACEMFPSTLPSMLLTNYKKNSLFHVARSNFPLLRHNEISLFKVQCDAVSVYTNGALTKEQDMLVAISGIAQTMHAILECDYLARLWQKGLPSHLLWLTGMLQAGKAKRHESYIAPSWPWA
jgi:hypothetical protein